MAIPGQPSVLILNASLGGDTGNTAALLHRARDLFGIAGARVLSATFANDGDYGHVRPKLLEADAFLFGTGTHWDSWSHLLQKFLEDATPDEATDLWLGKPAGVIVTMHSVGGKAVLSRLQGILNTFGCSLPPMSGLVYSQVGQAAKAAGDSVVTDIWIPEDVEVVCHNLLASLTPQPVYRAWPVDRRDYAARWISV